MNNDQIFDELERNGVVFETLLHDLPEEMLRWRSAEGKWNLLDIVCHLLDEEREDFRVRVSMVLQDPNASLPSINPEGWVAERKYQNQDFESTLDTLIEEREKSVDRLRSLKNPHWDNEYDQPKMGGISAQMFLENWLAHDHLHLRQIIGVKFAYLKKFGSEPLNYAGNW
ncbi:MAG: hypothetical protein ACI9FU_001777 [Granulosicoccus sp.]|jgi:hypothetical protein